MTDQELKDSLEQFKQAVARLVAAYDGSTTEFMNAVKTLQNIVEDDSRPLEIREKAADALRSITNLPRE